MDFPFSHWRIASAQKQTAPGANLGPLPIVTIVIPIVIAKTLSGQATTGFWLADCHIVIAEKVLLAAAVSGRIYTRIILTF